MNWFRRYPSVLTLAIIGSLAGFAHAQENQTPTPPDPDVIAARCITHINADADQAIDDIQRVTDEALSRIEDQLNAGQLRGALQTAHRASRLIGARAQRCLGHINGHTQTCVRLLQRLDADAQIQSVRAASREAKDRVRSARELALTALRDALPERPE